MLGNIYIRTFVYSLIVVVVMERNSQVNSCVCIYMYIVFFFLIFFTFILIGVAFYSSPLSNCTSAPGPYQHLLFRNFCFVCVFICSEPLLQINFCDMHTYLCMYLHIDTFVGLYRSLLTLVQLLSRRKS